MTLSAGKEQSSPEHRFTFEGSLHWAEASLLFTAFASYPGLALCPDSTNHSWCNCIWMSRANCPDWYKPSLRALTQLWGGHGVKRCRQTRTNHPLSMARWWSSRATWENIDAQIQEEVEKGETIESSKITVVSDWTWGGILDRSSSSWAMYAVSTRYKWTSQWIIYIAIISSICIVHWLKIMPLLKGKRKCPEQQTILVRH